MESEQLVNPTVNKDIIRKGIRECYKNDNPVRNVENIKEPYFKAIDNAYNTFLENFRNAGGIYFPCNNIPGNNGNLVHMLVALLKSQNYLSILNTCPFINGFLNKYGIRYQSTITFNEPAEAAIVFSDRLIARDGSFGILQEHAQYPSIRNLSSDLIVISFLPCIYNDRTDALEAYKQKHENANPPLIEYIRPTKLEDIQSKSAGSPTEPRIFLFMLEENIFEKNNNVPKTVDNESKNEESAN